MSRQLVGVKSILVHSRLLVTQLLVHIREVDL
jgi:hypothetical protein